MMIEKIIMIVVFAGYIIPTMLTGRKAESISASFYKWPDWQGIFFIAMCFGISLPVAGLVKHDPWTNWNFLLLGSAFMIIVTGCFAAFRERAQELIHVAGSILGILLGLVGLWLVYGYWPGVVLFIVWYLFIQTHPKIKAKTWWIEVAAFLIIWSGLVIEA